MEGTLGPYRLVSPIGRGGMGETFVGERTGLAGFAQRVCVKRILAQDSADPRWILLFQREARIAATLQHPNIVSLYDFGRDGTTWWMSLELVDGVDLRALMTAQKAKGTRLPLEAVLFIAAELAKALAHAHGQRAPQGAPAPIVHRDVSPTNILVSKAGSVKLADFGMATVLDEERTRTGRAAGKAGYVAPEQADARPFDHRADLFSLGVVLFEMLAGTRPYDGASQLMTFLNSVRGNVKDLRALAPGVPEPLVAIIHSLIAGDPNARMPNADALLDALGALPVRPNVVRTLGALASEARAARDEDAKEGPTTLDPR